MEARELKKKKLKLINLQEDRKCQKTFSQKKKKIKKKKKITDKNIHLTFQLSNVGI